MTTLIVEHLQINSDTKDALLFVTGFLGILSQAVLFAFGVDPSPVLLATFSIMCGIAAAPSIMPSHKNGGRK